MPLLTTSFLALNPEIDKLKYVTENHYIYDDLFSEHFDVKSTYFLCRSEMKSKYEILKEKIEYFFNNNVEDYKISSSILRNSFYLLDLLSPSQIEELDYNNIYATPYGTLVLDWEKDKDNVFSLELGVNGIGYFIEIDGKDEKQVDSIDLFKNRSEIFQDLSSFLIR